MPKLKPPNRPLVVEYISRNMVCSTYGHSQASRKLVGCSFPETDQPGGAREARPHMEVQPDMFFFSTAMEGLYGNIWVNKGWIIYIYLLCLLIIIIYLNKALKTSESLVPGSHFGLPGWHHFRKQMCVQYPTLIILWCMSMFLHLGGFCLVRVAKKMLLWRPGNELLTELLDQWQVDLVSQTGCFDTAVSA